MCSILPPLVKATPFQESKAVPVDLSFLRAVSFSTFEYAQSLFLCLCPVHATKQQWPGDQETPEWPLSDLEARPLERQKQARDVAGRARQRAAVEEPVRRLSKTLQGGSSRVLFLLLNGGCVVQPAQRPSHRRHAAAAVRRFARLAHGCGLLAGPRQRSSVQRHERR